MIFDEAHYSATSQKDEDKRETPYSSLLNFLNSDDYPNVIVLLVTATPWNLITISSKIEKTEVKHDNDGRLISCQGTLSALETNRKVPLHEIPWNHGYEGDFRVGKKLKLMALMDNLKYSFLCADFNGDGAIRVNQCEDEANSSIEDRMSEATTFTITGSMYGSVCLFHFKLAFI